MKNFYLNDFQIHDNGQDLGFIINQNYQGLDSPDIRLTSYDRPGQHGSVVSNQLYSGRNIILPGRISGPTVNQYRINRRTLQNLTRIVKDGNAVSQPVLLKFKTMDNLLLQTYVYLKSTFTMPDSSLNHGTFILNLYAPDYNLYSQSLGSYALTLPTSTGLVYPVIYPVIYPGITGGTISVTNEGDSNTPLTLTFNGPLTSPFITNLTTGETFATSLTLGIGDKLVVDMQKKTMLLNDSSNALQYFVLSNTWMELIPGVNVLKMGSALSSDMGNVLINFRSAYLGI